MTIQKLQIHFQLAADSHELFKWQHCHLRLHKNASLPWLIIIPETALLEFHDLPQELQLEITHISRTVSQHFISQCGAEKINFAAIGNVVQQLHIHVIGRHPKDPLWPDVVWGNELPVATYTNEEFESIKADFIALLEGTFE
ncbi:MAG: HIT family protein [Marinicella sp.]